MAVISTIFVYLICILLALLSASEGSKIQFTATPKEVSPCMSKTLTLRCSLSDTISSSSNTVVGRDLTQTSYDVSLVLSVLVMKASDNNKTMASITTLNGGVAKTDVSSLRIQGDLSSSPGERAYLEMTWDDPTSTETGDYLCEINTLDPLGHSVIFFAKAKVTLDVPCPTELARRIKLLEDDQKMLADMKTKLDKLAPPHSEQGVVVCGPTDNWQVNNQLTLVDYQKPFTGKQVTKKVTFKEPYESAPTVHVGMATIGAYANLAYISYDIGVTGVDKDGFTVVCTSFSDSKYFRFNVNWISTN